MSTQGLVARVEAREEAAWQQHEDATAYHREVRRLLGDLASSGSPQDRVAGVVALASRTLRRDGDGLLDLQAACAEALLAQLRTAGGSAPASRIRLLFLQAWLRIGAAAARGPETIATAPDLPSRLLAQYQADPSGIEDRGDRERAAAAVQRHTEEAHVWNTRQRAVDHLRLLASLAQELTPPSREEALADEELRAAMALGPGLPPETRRALRPTVTGP